MNRLHYETGILLASGAVIGQIIVILVEMSFSIWSFLPLGVLVMLLGYISLKKIGAHKGLITASDTTKVVTGIVIFVIWDLFRKRFFWPVDIMKFLVLLGMLYFLFRVLKRTWRE